MSACGLEPDVRSLRGSHLSADERVFAAMLWRCERWRAQLAEVSAEYALAPSRQLAAVTEALLPQMVETQRTLRKLSALWAPGGVLAAAGLAQQMRSRLAGVAQFEAVRAKFDVARLAPAFALRRSVALPRVSPLVLPEHVFNWQRNWTPVIEQLRELVADQAANAFVRRWENSSLWFIFALLTMGVVRPLAELDNEQVEAAVLDALEVAVADAQFAAGLRAMVEAAGALTPRQRRNLCHGLEHAERGEWIDASAPLLAGLEGAFWSAARALNVITTERMLAARPTKRMTSVDALFKHLPAPGVYVTFLRHRVFGTAGDPLRHGEGDGSERRAVLFGVAAIVGWLDTFEQAGAGRQLGGVLVAHLRPALPAAA